MELGLMFFSAARSSGYRMLVDATRFADRAGFRCVWTPERHFHDFGGLFPNPALTSAALAMATERLELRAGSLISPLHDPVRIAEDWSVVDNLSGGRVAISFGSGWNANDFVFFPERYERRKEVMVEQIETVRRLWSGQRVERTNGEGRPVEISIVPVPIQAELPVWVTSSGNPETFSLAGEIGANVLTHLIGQTVDELEPKITAYRAARARVGLVPEEGVISLMLHTFLGNDVDAVRAQVRKPFREYLRSAIGLERMAAATGGAISGGHRVEEHEIRPETMEELLDATFERYFSTGALMGTVESCLHLVWRLGEAGIDEIACLIDFGPQYEAVMEGLKYLDELRSRISDESMADGARAAVQAFLSDPSGGD